MLKLLWLHPIANCIFRRSKGDNKLKEESFLSSFFHLTIHFTSLLSFQSDPPVGRTKAAVSGRRIMADSSCLLVSTFLFVFRWRDPIHRFHDAHFFVFFSVSHA